MKKFGPPAIAMTLVLCLGGPASGQDDRDLVACSAEATWLNCPESTAIENDAGNSVVLHLLGQVSTAPGNVCLPAELHLTVAYLDVNGGVLCVGTVEEIASLERHVQDAAIELNPSVLRNFGRWLNEPGRQAAPPFSPLGCFASDGRSQLLDSHLAEATGLSITATLLPETGGVAAAECRLRLR